MPCSILSPQGYEEHERDLENRSFDTILQQSDVKVSVSFPPSSKSVDLYRLANDFFCQFFLHRSPLLRVSVSVVQPKEALAQILSACDS